MSFTMMLDSMFFSLGWGYRTAIIIAVMAIAALLAYSRRFLDAKGIAAAALLGFIVFYIGGVSGIVIFLFFFLSSSIITKLCSKDGKRGRSYSSVAANGVPAAAAIILYALTYDRLFLVAFASAVAEATADTWAGEIGQLSHKDSVSIVTFTKVPKGISGGVTVLGLAASLIASFLVAVLFAGTFGSDVRGVLTIAAAGFLGALFDSLLGAAVQAQYRREDGSLTEDPSEGTRVRGVPFIDNDMVNFLSGLFALSVSVAMSLM